MTTYAPAKAEGAGTTRQQEAPPEQTQETPPAKQEPAPDPNELFKKAYNENDRKWLKTLGVTSADEAKEALAKFREIQDSQKDVTQRLAEREARLNEVTERATRQDEVIKGLAESQIEALPSDALKNLVRKVDGPLNQIDFIASAEFRDLLKSVSAPAGKSGNSQGQVGNATPTPDRNQLILSAAELYKKSMGGDHVASANLTAMFSKNPGLSADLQRMKDQGLINF